MIKIGDTQFQDHGFIEVNDDASPVEMILLLNDFYLDKARHALASQTPIVVRAKKYLILEVTSENVDRNKIALYLARV